jgi:hypothetical protein
MPWMASVEPTQSCAHHFIQAWITARSVVHRCVRTNPTPVHPQHAPWRGVQSWVLQKHTARAIDTMLT